MKRAYNASILSYYSADSFFNVTGRATAETPEFPSARAIFRACKLEDMPSQTAFLLRDQMGGMGVQTLLFPKAADDGQDVMDVVLLGTLDRYEAGLSALLTKGDADLAGIAAEIQEALTLYEDGLGRTACGATEFVWGTRTYVMGIVNVTPDSFSGDGILDADAALKRALRFVEDGADIIDVGGESSRPSFTYPGAKPTDEKTELERVLPVLRLLSREIKVPISIDTYRANTARAALEAGAAMVNDVWGLTADPNLARVVAEYDVPIVLMHNKRKIEYRNLMSDIIRELRRSIDIALEAGVKWENIIVDPGIGFGKTKEHNFQVMSRLDELKVLGRPILLGTSRKSFVGYILSLPPDQRVEGTAATVALGIAKGADIVRVHDVREMVRVARVSDAIVRR